MRKEDWHDAIPAISEWREIVEKTLSRKTWSNSRENVVEKNVVEKITTRRSGHGGRWSNTTLQKTVLENRCCS
jgi:hypothetical protein